MFKPLSLQISAGIICAGVGATMDITGLIICSIIGFFAITVTVIGIWCELEQKKGPRAIGVKLEKEIALHQWKETAPVEKSSKCKTISKGPRLVRNPAAAKMSYGAHIEMGEHCARHMQVFDQMAVTCGDREDEYSPIDETIADDPPHSRLPGGIIGIPDDLHKEYDERDKKELRLICEEAKAELAKPTKK